MREEERILNGAIDQLDDVDNLWMPRNLRHKQLITLSGDDVNTLLMISRSLADRAGRYFFQVDKILIFNSLLKFGFAKVIVSKLV